MFRYDGGSSGYFNQYKYQVSRLTTNYFIHNGYELLVLAGVAELLMNSELYGSPSHGHSSSQAV